MTRPHAPLDHLADAQAVMLDHMRAALGPVTFAALHRVTGLTRTLANRHLDVLRERELVDLIRAGKSHKPALWAISRTGSRALARHKRQAEQAALEIVPPPTYNTIGTFYEPPPRSYYRNEGNKHIASRGVSC